MKIIDKAECCGCHACYNVCQVNAISMEEDAKGFKYPVVNKSKCINCGMCKKVCPIVNSVKVNNLPYAYAAYNKDEKTRLASSSGGIFTLIAEYILEHNGIVIGSSFDSNFMVEHICIDNKDDLYKLRTSKYVQSSIGDTYRKAKQYLKQGKLVLFTGTPCQIEGLKSYLINDYDNLYTQDIICHGVPSPKVWDKYLEYRKKKYGSRPVNVNFRNKESGWDSYSMMLQYKNKTYREKHGKDIYMQAFLSDTSLRDSCYKCSFKKINRISDITLADFWGIKNVIPNMNDNKGTSLIIINSKKGKKLYQAIQEKIISKKVDFYKSISYNQSMTKSASIPKTRENFWENIDNLEFDKLVSKYTPKDKIVKRALRKIKHLVFK